MGTERRPRMTVPTQLVLRAMLENPSKPMYGLEICAAAGLPSGTISPMLARLEGVGWLESYPEDIDPSREGRPRRRYYRFTPDGAELARHALARAYQGRRVPAWRPTAAGPEPAT